MKRLPFQLLPLLLLGITGFAQNSGSIETDRPDQTETPYLTPKRWFQAELGFNRERSTDGTVGYVHPTMLAKYGLGNRVELRAIVNYVTYQTLLLPNGTVSESGFLPLAIGGKLRIAEEKGWIPKTSLIAHISVPDAATSRFRSNGWAPDFRFVMQHNLTEAFSISYNLGAQWDGEIDEPEWLYTFAPGLSMGKKWYAYIESFAFFRKGFHPHFNYDGGIAYQLTDNMQLDVSGGFGVGNSDLDHYVALGFSFRMPTGSKKAISQ